MTTITSRSTDQAHIVSASRLDDIEKAGSLFPGTLTLVRQVGAPMLWAVWDRDDIIGAGRTSGIALADAAKTVAGWAVNLRAGEVAL